jgi:hypothetical protein
LKLLETARQLSLHVRSGRIAKWAG